MGEGEDRRKEGEREGGNKEKSKCYCLKTFLLVSCHLTTNLGAWRKITCT